MGRIIRLDQPDGLDDDWILPGYLRRYDQRMRPWPNDLFPHELHIYDHPIQGIEKVLIRRCIEQECRGDVAFKRVYTSNSLIWSLWFQFSEDQSRVKDLVDRIIDASADKA